MGLETGPDECSITNGVYMNVAYLKQRTGGDQSIALFGVTKCCLYEQEPENLLQQR